DSGEVTPATLPDRPVGDLSVDVVIEGYSSDGPKNVTVSDGETTTIAFTLTQQTGSIQVTSTPSGAKIFVNGTDSGEVTPATLPGRAVGNYSVDVVLEGYKSDGPKEVTVSDGETNTVQFELTQDFYTLSGVVTGADSVTITLSGDISDTRIVNDGEKYSFSLPGGGNYTVTPLKECYEFTPSTQTFADFVSDMTQDFSAIRKTYTISGTVSGADNVIVRLSGDMTDSLTVNDGGSYTFTVACGGIYMVTPAHSCFEFAPANKSYENITADETQNYIATLINYTISGTVNGIDEVVVRLSGDFTDSLTVNDGGSYSFTVACGGTYMVTPSRGCYEFTPENKVYENLTADMTQDFAASQTTYTISGLLTGANDVTFTLSGAAQETQVVNDGETYSFTVLCGGYYSVTPSKPGHKFKPDYIGYTNVTSDKVRNVTATPSGLPEGINFVSIHGGSFSMGSKNGGSDEQPVHTVNLDDFDMSEKEITNAQFCEYLNAAIAAGDIKIASNSMVVGLTGDYASEEYLNLAMDDDVFNKCWIRYGGGSFTVEPGKENWPVVAITWYGAKSFCQYFGLELPTEAEWEYAAKGGMDYEYGTDDGTIKLSNANFVNENQHPIDVGNYAPNPYGLYDMSGNVWEFCNDWYGPYQKDDATNPTGPTAGTMRVKRGGGWVNEAELCRSALRSSYNPGYNGPHVGFRVVRR
ncbi:MAG: SUMF1/EgtB/PvdO family nonheme iron enzyme, partial [Candidatus Latescibacteria bacterium]|nr:SUMF1/EgtB/PvdO family nonheme iron enzyme [Candidatus Latescibacterota bacterium]